MTGRRWFRGLRLSVARLPVGAPASDGPVHAFRDPWKGDPDQGARLVAGHFRLDRQEYALPKGEWERGPGRVPWPEPVRQWLHGFAWLRDLRALGSDQARLTARALVADWLDHPPTDPLVRDACVTGSRLASWLSNYEFCLASADARLQRRLMDRMLIEARTIAALLPLDPQGWRGLMAFRGLLAAAMAMPGQTGFMSRFLRYLPAELDRLILADGTAVERSPDVQFLVARELAEMSVMFRAGQTAVPPFVSRALDRVCPVLRAMRHGDGALALFNGGSERHAAAVEDVLAQGARQKLIAPSLPDGKFTRLALGKSLLIVDSGPPPPSGFDQAAHAGTLSFEFSHQRHRLFVNCGSALTGAWRDAMRSSAAHNVLVAEGLSSSDFVSDGGMTRRPVTVTCEHQTTGSAHWLDLSHDGYHAPLGAKWTRRLYFGEDGEDLRGQDVIEGERPVDFAIRFHIHPDVRVTQEDEDVILRSGSMIWRFRQREGVLRVENDVYLGRGRRETSRQIVITPLPRRALGDAPGEVLGEAPGDASSQVAHSDAAAPEREPSANAVPDAQQEDAASVADTSVARSPAPAPEPVSAASDGSISTSSPVPPSASPSLARRSSQTVTWLLERLPE